MSTLFATPHIRVFINVLKESGFDIQGEQFEFDNTLYKNLMRVSITKSVGPSAGTFTLELSGAHYGVASKQPDNPNDELEITPQSIVKIFVNDTLKMIGLVDQTNVQIGMSGNKPTFRTTVEGRDLTKLFIEQKIMMNEFIEVSEALKKKERDGITDKKPRELLQFDAILPSIFIGVLNNKWFTEIGQGADKKKKPIPQQSWYKFIFDAVYIGKLGESEGLYKRILKRGSGSDSVSFGFGDGASFADLFDTSFSMVSDKYLLKNPIIDFMSVLTADVNMLRMWDSVSFPPLVEIILDTYPPNIEVQNFNTGNTLIPGQNKLHLVVRENPFIDEDDRGNFSSIPIHRIDLAQVKNFNISKSDANTFNVIFVKPVIDIFQQNIDFLTTPAVDNFSLVRHGYKYMEIMLRYYDLGQSDDDKKTAIDQMQEVANRMIKIYGKDYKKYTGTIEIHNMNDYRAGERILVEVPTQSGKKLMEFYIQSVNDEFVYNQGYTTRLNVIRGRETTEDHETALQMGSRYTL